MIHPLFLDVQPEYMQGCQEPMSLLLGPAGDQRLITLLQETLNASTQAPVVLPQFTTSDAYVAAITEHCSGARVVPFAQFDQTAYDASDWLLFIDPRFYCDAALRMPAMLRDGARLRALAAHLVAMARHEGGINERIEFAADGRVRKIQRYYDSATWPQLTGVACSLTSVACFRTHQQPLVFESLEDLRRQLAERGVPSRDVPIEGGVFDLRKPGELLRLNERLLASPQSDPAMPRVASGDIHPTARLIGPIVVHDRASVEEGATVVGPAIIGAGARVRAHAVVAQSIVGDGLTIPAGSVLRHRAVFAKDSLEAPLVAEIESVVDEISAPEFDTDRGRRQPLYARAKLIIDRTIAGVALILLSPLFAIIAALIKLDSRGDVFFRDSREGWNGELFQCWKFRTMHIGSDVRQRELFVRNDVDGPQFKLERDPRLTRVGRWLRPMSFDELPQLFNVLRGDMSLIGPRPSPFRENQQCVPWRDARLSVRPGITGLWQVCRFDRPGGDFHQWIYFDLLYVQQMSFWLDLKILIATILSRGGQKNVSIDRLINMPRLRP